MTGVDRYFDVTTGQELWFDPMPQDQFRAGGLVVDDEGAVWMSEGGRIVRYEDGVVETAFRIDLGEAGPVRGLTIDTDGRLLVLASDQLHALEGWR